MFIVNHVCRIQLTHAYFLLPMTTAHYIKLMNLCNLSPGNIDRAINLYLKLVQSVIITISFKVIHQKSGGGTYLNKCLCLSVRVSICLPLCPSVFPSLSDHVSSPITMTFNHIIRKSCGFLISMVISQISRSHSPKNFGKWAKYFLDKAWAGWSKACMRMYHL